MNVENKGQRSVDNELGIVSFTTEEHDWGIFFPDRESLLTGIQTFVAGEVLEGLNPTDTAHALMIAKEILNPYNQIDLSYPGSEINGAIWPKRQFPGYRDPTGLTRNPETLPLQLQGRELTMFNVNDAYLLRISNNAAEQKLAEMLGVSRQLATSEIQLVLSTQDATSFELDCDVLARRLQPVATFLKPEQDPLSGENIAEQMRIFSVSLGERNGFQANVALRTGSPKQKNGTRLNGSIVTKDGKQHPPTLAFTIASTNTVLPPPATEMRKTTKTILKAFLH